MKLRHLLFIGLASAVLFAGCKEEEETTGTPSITIDPTSLTFAQGGETKSITLTASRDWVVEVPSAVQEWLTVSPTSGSASNDPQTITIEAQANTGANRNAQLVFNASLVSATLQVSQEGPEGETDGINNVTVKEFLAASVDDSDTAPLYRITGTLVYVRSFNYGNVYIEDETGVVYAYGLCSDENLTYQSYGDIEGLTVGDQITVVGKRGYHENAGDELVDCYHESHTDAVITPTISNISIADFLEAEVSYSQKNYYRLTGTISEISDSYAGELTISDEEGSSVLVYNMTADNSFTYASFGELGLNVGDVLTLVGCRGEHNGSPQVVNGYYESHEDGEDPTPEPEYPWTLGSSAYTENASNINGESKTVLKLGTSSKSGDATINVPSGTKSFTVYAVSWKGKPSKLTFSGVDGLSPTEITPAANDGATGNAPYPNGITVSDSDKYTFTFTTALVSDTQITVTSEARNLLWDFEFVSE